MQLRLRSKGYVTTWCWGLARCMCCFPLLSPLTHSAAGFGLYSLLFHPCCNPFLFSCCRLRAQNWKRRKCAHISEFETARVGWPHWTRPKAALPTLMMTLHWPGLNEGATDVPSPSDKVIVSCWPWTRGTRVFLEKVVQQSSQECGLWSQAVWFEF